MARGFEAVSTVTIAAPIDEVWDALTNPEKVKQYMHGTNLSTDWKKGSPIRWRGEWKGKSYEDKGEVLEVKPQRLLRYTHWSPMGGSEDKPENYHTVTCELAGDDGKTTLTLIQDNNPTQEEADKMARDNWGPVLNGLGSRASSRHASIAPRTTSARGPRAWDAPRTRTHRSIPAPSMPVGASHLPPTVPCPTPA
ncbi:MAG: hypothetical protein E6I89_13535 [Chloroflexi bacterium]|nr:MAG: hypothetical protein E6I89_13535 [Chloroflexota bacterium]